MNLHAGFKKYLSNISWLMVERIVRMGVSLFVGIYVARYLGPSDYGLLSYANSFVGLFLALATLGLDSIVIQKLVESPERRDELLGTTFILKAGGIVLMLICIMLWLLMSQSDATIKILIGIIACSVVSQTFNVIDFNYQALVQSKYVVYAKLFQLIISVSIKVFLILIAAPLVWFAMVFFIESCALAFGLFVMYERNTGRLSSWIWSKKTAIELLAKSWPLILSSMTILIYMRIDQVMIKEMLGAEEVGLYAVAANLSEAWYFIPVIITASLFPSIINAKNESQRLYNQRLQALYDLMVILAVIVAIPVSFLAPQIIMLLYGEAFSGASDALRIHVWAGIFVFLNNASWKWYILENKLTAANLRLFVGLLVNIFLNLLLIPKYGITGAAVATLVSRSVASYFGNLILADTRELFVFQTKSLLFISTMKRFLSKE